MIVGGMIHISVEDPLDRQTRIGTSIVTYHHTPKCRVQTVGVIRTGQGERDWLGGVVHNQERSEGVTERREESKE